MDTPGNAQERYTRQLKIPQWGEAAQQKLQAAHITVVGTGGLGSPVLYYLAAAGAGKLRLIDGDKVDISNLNRQILFAEEDIGKYKAQRAAEKIGALNSDIELEFIAETLTAENIEALIPATDVIVDCLDNFSTRFVLNKHAVSRAIPLVHAGIHSFSGQLTTILPGRTPCLECLFAGMKDPTLESGARIPSPVLGAVVGVIGSLQALEAIKIAGQVGNAYAQRLLIYDGLSGNFNEIEVVRDVNCPVCAAL
ncbi:MAG: HesA/MoeB/ThiF family protein [Spirochaetia bacterium]|nr:HesA/MoeB/ThiF family protein [Spirochaetia bacterium]